MLTFIECPLQCSQHHRANSHAAAYDNDLQCTLDVGYALD